jgi:signal transduction histidine kinase
VRIWPLGLVGQIIIVLLAAVLLEYAGSAVLFEWSVIYDVDDARAANVARQLGAALSELAHLPPQTRAEAAKLMSSEALDLNWAEWSPVTDDSVPRPALLGLRQRLLASAPDLAGHELRLSTGDQSDTGRHRDLVGAVALADESQITFVAPDLLSTLSPILGGLFSTGILVGCVLTAAILVIRTLGAPLRALVRATNAIGVAPPVLFAVQGPHEVRQVARAFNAMQQRIAHLLADRTQALAAVSHDLRTPIARMRLQTDFIEDPRMHAVMADSLAEMEAMIASVLTYLGGEADPEPRRPVDLATLLITQLDAATDAGHETYYAGPDHASATVRPLAIKRAFANLIGNAIAYGGAARVSLAHASAAIVVCVEDGGPGIPEADLERVFEPFCRLEASRNRNSGGVGLGLAIARQAVEREGGRLTLCNRSEGGLRAEVMLPR